MLISACKVDKERKGRRDRERERDTERGSMGWGSARTPLSAKRRRSGAKKALEARRLVDLGLGD